MAIPVWAVGQVLSASDVNLWFVPLAAVKPSDTARTGTSVTNDPDLQLSVAANAVYDVTVVAQYKGGTNNQSDCQCTINAPGGATGFWLFLRRNISGPLTLGYDASTFGANVNLGTNGTSNLQPLTIKASVTTSAAGTLALGWAKNSTTDATATTMMAGSYLIAQRIG